MKELNKSSNNLVEPPANQTEEEFKFDALEELGIKYNKNDKEDYEELKRLLTEFLTYPNHELAELHMESDRLGKEDLKSEILERLTNDKKSTDAKDKIEFCPCCGFIRQTKSIELCTHLREINNIGISTYLYFLTIKNLIILSVIMTIVYSIYGLASNVKASKEYQTLIEIRGGFSNIPISQLSTISYVSISLGSKKLDHKFENDQSYFIQCWLGLVVLIIWLFMFFCLRYTEQGEQSKVQQETISAADFTLLIENVPKDLKVPELKKKFDDYYETVSKSKIIPEYMKKPFDIEKINIGEPFYLNKEDFKDEELEELRKKHEKLKKKIHQFD